MKFKQYLDLISNNGFVPTPRFQWVIRQNDRRTSREEAIAAKIIEDANPRQNITGHYPWGPEQQMVLQQLWIRPFDGDCYQGADWAEWRDIPVRDASKLFSTVDTEHGPMPVPNAIKEPGTIKADFRQRLNELLGEEE